MTTSAATLARPARMLGIVFVPFATGFFLSFLLRNANAVISKDLIAEFSLSSTELGLLTSAYFLSFACMQIPVGVLLDRYGPRRVTAVLQIIAATGVAAFALAGGIGTLAFSRALIGAGVSACLMGSMKAYTMWFPLNRLATLNGWTLAAGSLGAVAATAPMEFAASLMGWRALFGLLALLTLLSGLSILLLVPEKPVPGASERWSEQLGKIAAIFRVPSFWRIGLPMIILQGVYQGLFGLWLIPWLIDTQGLDRSHAAQWLMWAGVTYALASVFFGQGADALAHRGVPRLALLRWGTALGVAAYFALVYAPGLPKFALLLAYSVGVVAPVLCYAILPPHFPVAVTGRLNTALNVSMFGFAFVVQTGTGMLLKLFPEVDGRYAAQGYATAFAILGLLQFVAWALVATVHIEPAAHREGR